MIVVELHLLMLLGKINGGKGNDTITLDNDQSDTVVRNGDGTTDGTDTINNFTAGNSGDVIDFETNNAANVTRCE